jgi:SRSO17 transposase
MGRMDREELLEARGRLEAFLELLLPLLGRSERCRWGAFYIQGLLLEGGRKTAAGMAAHFGGNVQAVQQFVNQSPWDWLTIRQALAQTMVNQTCGRGAWILDDTGFPKKGAHSVGVARQYSGTLGKIGNCQVAVSLNYATDEGCFPVNFQLYLPPAWIDDAERREKAGIPADITFRRKWKIGLEMLDQAREWGLPDQVVVADAGYGVATEFRRELEKRGHHYVVGITRETTVWTEPVVAKTPTYSGQGRPPKRDRTLPKPPKVFEVARLLPPDAWEDIIWREGKKGPMRGRFTALRVQPAIGYFNGKATESVAWLLIEWPRPEPEPIKYWFSNLPETTTLQELVYWAKIRWWIEQNYQQLKDELGLDHFEGRSWAGWHHHVTLTMMAFAFLVLEGFRAKKNYWVDPPTRQKGTPTHAHREAWLLPLLLASNHNG